MVGSHLVDHLLKKQIGKYLVRVDGEALLIILVIFQNYKSKPVYLNYMDLTDYSSVYECLKQVKPDFIFHLAAQSFPKASFNL